MERPRRHPGEPMSDYADRLDAYCAYIKGRIDKPRTVEVTRVIRPPAEIRRVPVRDTLQKVVTVEKKVRVNVPNPEDTALRKERDALKARIPDLESEIARLRKAMADAQEDLEGAKVPPREISDVFQMSRPIEEQRDDIMKRYAAAENEVQLYRDRGEKVPADALKVRDKLAKAFSWLETGRIDVI